MSHIIPLIPGIPSILASMPESALAWTAALFCVPADFVSFAELQPITKEVNAIESAKLRMCVTLFMS
ncbi:MAG: hypothetical protein ACR2NS_04220 [Gemmatimonadaceae bacterium]